MARIRNVASLALILSGLLLAGPVEARQPTLIVAASGGWTGEEKVGRAEAVAMADTEILAVGSREAILSLRGKGTRVVDRPGTFLLPGFIDNHTHFDRAGSLLVGVNLLDVADEAAFRQRVREARERLPDGAWILGGDWVPTRRGRGTPAVRAPRRRSPAASSPTGR